MILKDIDIQWKVVEALRVEAKRKERMDNSQQEKPMSKQEDLKFWIPNTAVVNSDIEGLVGSKLTVITRDGDIHQGVVAGADPYIGLSIVKEGDPKRVLLCIHGPFDPGFRVLYNLKEEMQVRYNKQYPVCLKFIRESMKIGKVDVTALFEELNVTSALHDTACPYGM